MSEARIRLYFRVAPDNPILQISSRERSQKAEEWLRIGADIERIERATNKLEKIANRLEKIVISKDNGTVQAVQEDRDPKIEEMDRKLIMDILGMGGSNKQ
ncbi:hypothetical protein [Syntrophomonas palmitatica]|uniref:hypothetical protein n=1 Tax=Syntrophomonas palmitatica TaxID=402877 RepID=UPI0006D15954|nr:hypothetical protein [Syntrophomonas palmitatica]